MSYIDGHIRNSVIDSLKPAKITNLLKDLPDSPGVYLFYGQTSQLLYVGKSRKIRTRVRSHFSARNERWLRRLIERVEVRETAGELGALLLESQLIKELKPMYNVASRQRRRIIVARRVDNAQGYACIRLEAVDYLEVTASSPVVAIFKSKTQAHEYLSKTARAHRLCPKLLRLESSRKYCFSYHLGQCKGACMGEEEPGLYNARFEQAFEARRVVAWPFGGGVLVEERGRTLREFFVIDNWCLVASFRQSNGSRKKFLPTNHRFDYDTYKLLYAYLMNEANKKSIRGLERKEVEEGMWKEEVERVRN